MLRLGGGVREALIGSNGCFPWKSDFYTGVWGLRWRGHRLDVSWPRYGLRASSSCPILLLSNKWENRLHEIGSTEWGFIFTTRNFTASHLLSSHIPWKLPGKCCGTSRASATREMLVAQKCFVCVHGLLWIRVTACHREESSKTFYRQFVKLLLPMGKQETEAID